MSLWTTTLQPAVLHAPCYSINSDQNIPIIPAPTQPISPNQCHQIVFIPLQSVNMYTNSNQAASQTQQIIQLQPLSSLLNKSMNFRGLPNMLQSNVNHNSNHNNSITFSQISLPTAHESMSIINSTFRTNENITPHVQTTAQKTTSLDTSQYKINDNGTFQCLIVGKKTNKICNKTFTQRSSLIRHKKSAHDNYKPFKCKFQGCLLSFARSNLLKLHTRVHSGERPHKCPHKQCNRAFKQRSHLKEHLRIHTGEKPYKCKICGVRFRQKSVLDTHKRRHTGERPFKCQLCGKDFSHYTSFWRHNKNQICIK